MGGPVTGGMTVRWVYNRLVLDARVIITDHWPRPGKPDWCPVCHHAWMCEPTRVAYAYLKSVGKGRWIPPHLGDGGG